MRKIRKSVNGPRNSDQKQLTESALLPLLVKSPQRIVTNAYCHRNVKILIVYKCLLTVYLAQIKGSYMFIQNRQLLTVSISVPFYRGV